MVWLIFSPQRRRKLVEDASRSREDYGLRAAAIGVVIFYNLVGVLDIVSTSLAIGLGVAEEANPVLRSLMDNVGHGWIAAKLLLQSVVSAMVLWFPHRFVLTLFAVAVAANALIVINNFSIIANG